ncbi:MAG: GAF domain-containing protein [Planctomycetes bacterium]|nr:GAF domain-containing protein [Planctomycetota bacterium]
MTKKNIQWQNDKVHAAQYAQQLEILNKISRTLTCRAHIKEAFSSILDLMDGELGLNRGTITLLAPDDNKISIESVHGLSKEKSQLITYRLGEGVTGKVVETGKAMIIPKVSQEPLFLNRFERWNITKEDLSFICVPISVGSEVIGTLSVDKPYHHAALLDDDARVLNIISGIIAIVFKTHRDAAIERQLFEDETQRLYAQLKDKEHSKKITGSGSLNERTQLFERNIIIDVLKNHNGNITAVARDLQTTARIIRYKVKGLSIDPIQYFRKRK